MDARFRYDRGWTRRWATSLIPVAEFRAPRFATLFDRIFVGQLWVPRTGYFEITLVVGVEHPARLFRWRSRMTDRG